jgi:hypothetical protein
MSAITLEEANTGSDTSKQEAQSWVIVVHKHTWHRTVAMSAHASVDSIAIICEIQDKNIHEGMDAVVDTNTALPT